MEIIADYNEECEAFEALLAPECDRRVLLFHGASGCGKTTLLQHCLRRVPKAMPYIPIQLRGSVVGVAEIFARAGHRLDWEQLPRFTGQVAAFQGMPQVQIDRNWLLGINNRISVVLNVESPTDRQGRRVALTDAWFQDVRSFEGPLLVVLDTYEDATSDVKDWIDGPFLARVAEVGQLRVLVAGQEVPDVNNIEWGECCTARKLLGVPEAAAWWPVVEGLKRHVPFDSPLTWLAGVCHALKGRPNEIMKVIEALPERQESA